MRRVPDPSRAVLVRTDRIGDLVLTMPAMKAFARSFPGCRISAVVSPRTADLLRGQEWIQDVFRWDSGDRFWRLFDYLRRGRFDTAVFYFPRFASVLAARLARIPFRIGTAYRWYSPLLSHRVRVHRSLNVRHELEYNFDLHEPLGLSISAPVSLVAPVIDAASLESAERMRQSLGLAKDFVIVHPGSGGSALNPDAFYYSKLVRELERSGYDVVLTGTAGETGLLEDVKRGSETGRTVIAKPENLLVLAALIKSAKAVVGPSTGPVHMAASLDVPVVALYPPLRAQSPVRWRPWSVKSRVLSPAVPECERCPLSACPKFNCMVRISPVDVAESVRDLAGK